MSTLISKQARLVGSLTVASALLMTSLPALAQTESMGGDCNAIQFELANPAPGSRVDPGTYVVQGVALDTRAEDGPGIDRIDFFLGNREQGGVLLGHAVPDSGDSFGPFGPNSFQTRITVPNMVGGRDIFGYAHSAVTGQENVIAFPIAVGVEPSKVADHMAIPEMVTCMGGTPSGPQSAEMSDAEMPMADMGAAEPAAQADEEAPAADMPAPNNLAAQMYLDIGNPASGDTVHVGRYMIEGIAFDRAAEEGAGIERIDIFLDNRDTGGVLIGSGQLGAPSPVPTDPDLSDAGWTARVTIPRTLTGGHTLFVYALSAVTGGELVVGIPVTVVP
jgi:hypothetical protein